MKESELKIENQGDNRRSQSFCDEFLNSTQRPRYLFGRNIYANKIAQLVDIEGFIDDYSDEAEFLGKPIFRIEQVPQNALVVILSAGKPFTAENRVKDYGLEHLDYFAFYKFSGLLLEPVRFLDGFTEDFKENRPKYERVYRLLRDKVSKEQFCKLVNFKLSYDLAHLRGFVSLEHKQYFESFLNLKEEGEILADAGGFDGYTSREFITRCPRYHSIHLFEPDGRNMNVAKDRLKNFKRINFYQLGLSNKKQAVRFNASGSDSKICEDGDVVIDADRLDDVIHERVTFIKMDIEGAESDAIEGAGKTVKKYHPKLAICVYHKIGDFWKIPEQIFSIRDDYDVYLRHYTESIYETVMFFIPKPPKNRPLVL